MIEPARSGLEPIPEGAHFAGLHAGRTSLRGRLLTRGGRPLALTEQRFRDGKELGQAVALAFADLREQQPEAWSSLGGAAVALDKGLRCALPVEELTSLLPDGSPLLTLPAHLAILLGSVPDGPSLLVSLGSELRLAAMDSTHTYREFRLQEGGGQWWTAELERLAEHSPKLRRSLAGLSRNQVMKALPRLLEGADFPSPDPVLKVRVDGLCQTIAESCLGLSTRLPGVRSISFSGFLHPSPMSRRIAEDCVTALKLREPRFPAEVGAALVGLSLHLENLERAHLGKPLEDGQPPADKWVVPPLLIRRLYRTRRPFDDYPVAVAR